MNLKESILNGQKTLGRHPITVPGWDGTAYIRELTGLERDRMQLAFEDFRKNVNGNEEDFTAWPAFVVAWCLVDADGKRVFEDHEVLSLASISSKTLDSVFQFACKVNGLGKYAEEILPNCSAGDRSVLSGSASPDTGSTAQ